MWIIETYGQVLRGLVLHHSYVGYCSYSDGLFNIHYISGVLYYREREKAEDSFYWVYFDDINRAKALTENPFGSLLSPRSQSY